MRPPLSNIGPPVFLLCLCLQTAAQQSHPVASAAPIEQRFAALRKSPLELYAFLYRMPKGGDLHSHVAGAVYAENLLQTAAENGLCIDSAALAYVKPSATGACSTAGKVNAAQAESDNQLAASLIDSLSMRDFVPGRESGHDHFFATFDKFKDAKSPEAGSFVVELIRRAAEQNESYLELMALSGAGVSPLGHQVGFTGDFAEAATKLRAAGIDAAVSRLKTSLDAIEQSRLKLLKCSEVPASLPCRVTVRYVYQVLREFPNDQLFAQVLTGFMLASQDPRVVAINFVQPEDGLNSMRNYHLQMRMLDYVKGLYPNVHITLHAGELALGMVPPEDLRYHMTEAIKIGHAERIGHGVSVMYENDATGLLALMKKNGIDVEVNLSSNDSILGVKDNNHPFPVYRKFGVPVTLSTDDEGVGRTHLTQEYQRAVLTYGLSYADVKQIVRNSLQYSFLSGVSYWTDAAYRTPFKNCQAGPQSVTCRSFLDSNDKARAQADLEARFRSFESASLHTTP